MQIIPNRRKDRILIRIRPEEFNTSMRARLESVDARLCHAIGKVTLSEITNFAHGSIVPRSAARKIRRGAQPIMISIPITAATKAHMARSLRNKFKGLTGTIKWERGLAS